MAHASDSATRLHALCAHCRNPDWCGRHGCTAWCDESRHKMDKEMRRSKEISDKIDRMERFMGPKCNRCPHAVGCFPECERPAPTWASVCTNESPPGWILDWMKKQEPLGAKENRDD